VPNCFLPILHFLLIIISSSWLIPNVLGQSHHPAEELIHQGDLIEVDELGGFDYDWRGRLNPEGFLDGSSKIVDPIFGLCLSPRQLADAIREIYAKTLRDPKVVVRILDRSQRPVAIFDGAVRQPMRLQIRRPVRLSELAVISGGFTDRAGGGITVLRPPNQSCDSPVTEVTITKVRIADILSGKAEANLVVRSGDIVTVEPVEPVYVTGGVNRPGRLDWREGATLSRVVAAAGGFSNRGVSGTATIFRKVGGDSLVIEADLDEVVSGNTDDITIQPFDIIDIPFRGDPKRTTPPIVETAESRVRLQALPLRVID
jgi:protein involved in polysaccharide export with SLBB domain